MPEIIPGILEKDWESIEQKLELVLPFAKTIQIDFIDGIFAPNTTFLKPLPFKKYKDKFFLEAQLLVDNPLSFIKRYSEVGFKRFIGQIEKMPDQKKFIDTAKMHGEAGLGIDIDTPIEAIKIDFNYPDCFTLLSVKAGFSGQAFIKQAIEKIKTLKKLTTRPIEIDGGINKETIVTLKELGIERYIVNSGLFKTKDIAATYQVLKNLVS